jgi:hypothetical protein
MPGRMCVPGCVTIRRAVATMSAATFLTGAQVDPAAAHLYAFLALIPLRLLDRGDRADVSTALVRHEHPVVVKTRSNRETPMHVLRKTRDIDTATRGPRPERSAVTLSGGSHPGHMSF